MKRSDRWREKERAKRERNGERERERDRERNKEERLVRFDQSLGYSASPVMRSE